MGMSKKWSFLTHTQQDRFKSYFFFENIATILVGSYYKF